MELTFVRPSRELLVELFEDSPSYFQRLHGGPFQDKDVTDVFDQMPPSVNEKEAWVAMDGEVPVGLVDFLVGYPEPGTAYIGFLLVRESRHGQGLGARLCRFVEETARCTKIVLAVLESNEPAFAFWGKMGFVATGEMRPFEGYSVAMLQKVGELR